MNTAQVCRKESVCPGDGVELRRAALGGVTRATRTWSAQLSAEDREDLVQETLLRFWLAYPDRWQSAPGALIAQIAANLTVDELRRSSSGKRGGSQVVSLEAARDVSEQNAPIDEQLIGRQLVHLRLQACRRLLSGSLTQVFDLVYVGGLSSREAGALLGASVAAVDTTASRLRTLLARQGITLARRSPSESLS